MRVLHVIGSIATACGGSTTATLAVLDALRERGVETDLVTTDDDGAGGRLRVPLGRFHHVDGQRTCFFPRQTSRYAASLPLGRWLLDHVAEYAMVHVHGLFTFAPIVAARVARQRNVPFIVCPHGVLNRWGRTRRRPSLKRLSIALLEAPILSSASCVQFTSTLERREAEDLGVPMRGVVVPLGMRLTALTPGAASAPVAGGPGRGQRLLYLGRIVPIKRVGLLLEAFARLVPAHPALELVVAGTGPEALLAELRTRAEALGVAGRIRWTGFVDAARREQLLAEATVFVSPSESENFGMSVVEAMAAGVPVVLTRGVAIADQVEAAAAGIVCDDTAASLAAGVALLLGDAGRRARMGAAGRRMAVEEFSLTALGSRIQQLYALALREAGRS